MAFAKDKQKFMLLYISTIYLKLVLTLSDDESLNRNSGSQTFYALHGYNFTAYSPIQ